MKRTLLFFLFLMFFIFSYFGRYRPVSLDRVNPTTKTVEIKGEVYEPGVYTLKWEATLKDLIELAGGLTEVADTASISLNQNVLDQEVIVIDTLNENSQARISINNASLEELDTLPGIGPALAQRIIDYRSNTRFTSLEQIKEVKGIGDKLFEKIKELIVL